MQVGPTSDFGAHMYSIHFLKILYHYTCATRAYQWGKCSGAIHRGQFCRWKASINPCFASTINCRSHWGSKHPLNSCTSCNSCKVRKSSNPIVPSVQPPPRPIHHCLMEMRLTHHYHLLGLLQNLCKMELCLQKPFNTKSKKRWCSISRICHIYKLLDQ
jgi:hypothetical protein